MALRIEARTEIKAEPKTATQSIDLICELAKAKNKSGLSNLISSGICVDIYNGQETAAQRIASEEKVDTDALEFLIKEFRANLNYAVGGAAQGGHLSLVENLIARGATLNDAVWGAALGGHLSLVENLIARGATLNYAVWGAARGGHLSLVENLIARGATLNYAVGGAAQGGHLSNETLALRLLASIQDATIRTRFADEAKSSNRTAFDMRTLVPKASTLADLSRTKKINFDQGLAWQVPEIQGLLAWARLEKYLPRSLSCLIATFLSPSLTDGKEAKDLFEKMRLDVRKVDLNIDLQDCYLSSSRFAWFRDTRPEKFNLVCQNAKSDQDIDRSIEDEIRRLTKKDTYFDLLQSHKPRR